MYTFQWMIQLWNRHMDYFNPMIKRRTYRAFVSKYTECQNKLITSSGRRSLKSKMNHIWTLIIHNTPHEAHLKIQRVTYVKNEKMRWNCKRSFLKNHRNCSLRTSTKGCLFFHSVSVAFVCAWEASSFSDFCKPLAISLHFTPFWLKQTFVFEGCLVRSTIYRVAQKECNNFDC